MDVFVVIVDWDYEGITLHGVYSTLEKAAEALRHAHVHNGGERRIEKVQLDALELNRWGELPIIA